MKEGAFSNTISQHEISPASHYYFKNYIDGIVPQLNLPANRRSNLQDNQLQNRGNQQENTNPLVRITDFIDNNEGVEAMKTITANNYHYSMRLASLDAETLMLAA